jgi:chromosome segregation ATPase
MSEDATRHLPNDDIRLILARFDSIDSRLDKIDSRLDGIDLRLDGIDLRLDSLDSRLTTLEDRVDKRLVETRPIWERALAEITETRVEMNARFEKLQTEMNEGFAKVRVEMDDGLRRVKGQVEALNQNMLEMQGDMKYFDRRISKLEAEPAQ